MNELVLTLRSDERTVVEKGCLAAVLECEAYTPYARLTATFLSQGVAYGAVNAVMLAFGMRQVFLGIADSVEQFWKDGRCFVRVQSRSFTSVLAQNELIPGLHTGMTLEKLMTGFYQFPNVSYEAYEGSGYIFVKDGASMWDSIVNFGYQLTGYHPFIQGNTVRFTPPSDAVQLILSGTQVLESGIVQDTTKLVSNYHMADINDNYDAYQLENTAAAAADIVRHKQLLLDRQYLSEPEEALQFRCRFSQRGWRARYVTYSGYHGEQLCDRVSFGDFLQDAQISRIRMTFGKNGIRTKLWAYDDGFYHIGEQ